MIKDDFETRRLKEINRLKYQMSILEFDIIEIIKNDYNRYKLIDLQNQYFVLFTRLKLIRDERYNDLVYGI
jgi:hypothetical protein